MTFYISKQKELKRKMIMNLIVATVSVFLIIVFFHHGLWSYHYSLQNPTWNKTKCDDMAYEHFFDIEDWP